MLKYCVQKSTQKMLTETLNLKNQIIRGSLKAEGRDYSQAGTPAPFALLIEALTSVNE